ncbi:MAG: magnesium transporter [Clostridia bacterium]|nr:magnesium transporter [Clostridia bacterium]
MAAEHSYLPEILSLLKKGTGKKEKQEKLSAYHEGDIADALAQLSPEERKRVYKALDNAFLSDVFAYLNDGHTFLPELTPERAAAILDLMDADDAVDILEELEKDAQKKILSMMKPERSKDVRLILSYGNDEIASKMTTNFIVVSKKLGVPQAMQEIRRQARSNDNIATIFVTDEAGRFYGTIRLQDLLTADADAELESVIYTAAPFLQAREKVSACIERIKSYAENSLPVLNDEHELIGIITAQDVVEVVDEEMGEDYAMLAGLTAEEDLKETTLASMKKRLPWLIVLLILGIGVSSVVGVFEGVVASLPIIICFQSLILDMAGNVGTQSLAVTIRVLMDENLKAGQRIRLVFKELKVGFCNGLFLGTLSFAFIGCYICFFKHTPASTAFLISACVGAALMAAMLISSLVGTVVPIFFHKIKVDPAVASGPLITTVNDLVAVVTYYGLAWILLIKVLHLA